MGAWIETVDVALFEHSTTVAPLVGAWIETSVSITTEGGTAKSHPSWVRGLKQLLA